MLDVKRLLHEKPVLTYVNPIAVSHIFRRSIIVGSTLQGI